MASQSSQQQVAGRMGNAAIRRR